MTRGNLRFHHFIVSILLVCFLISCSNGNPSDHEFRSIDGRGNNTIVINMNSILTALSRVVSSDYTDGISELSGADRPSPGEISNNVATQDVSIPNTLEDTDYLWQWGQFLDHDIDLTDVAEPHEPANIPVPIGGIFFDPDSTGTQEIMFNRSIFDPMTGTNVGNPRQQLNQITGWIDGSNVYGSDEERALALRTNDGTGRLRTSAGNLLPFNTDGLENAGGTSPNLFLAKVIYAPTNRSV